MPVFAFVFKLMFDLMIALTATAVHKSDVSGRQTKGSIFHAQSSRAETFPVDAGHTTIIAAETRVPTECRERHTCLLS